MGRARERSERARLSCNTERSEDGIGAPGHDVGPGFVARRRVRSIAGIYGAGDIVTYPGKVKLIATGFGEAATAINNAAQYINPKASVFPGHSSSQDVHKQKAPATALIAFAQTGTNTMASAGSRHGPSFFGRWSRS